MGNKEKNPFGFERKIHSVSNSKVQMIQRNNEADTFEKRDC